ncbi:hypothetical protein MPTK1_3g05170 [Marchantia polymorpha subsp. ruderalis]|uniref:Metallo-beta-lactamase domain-containing protein n=2 Tax=Marchantia polymorpha TaxID=3197 RepID=A0AAF6AXL3_MARPO|nr:hypothetical protein MARPO_0022s0011 [Marchantia polymorpha]BBN04497.1 hypothetical protein Mp_3g05170 [Marchantia polymorpha subsp. ruderalis]|eukprot:PTQ43903.1 hypothetical protein MARPO_0022s0011 [Marchantia polymorpha]
MAHLTLTYRTPRQERNPQRHKRMSSRLNIKPRDNSRNLRQSEQMQADRAMVVPSRARKPQTTPRGPCVLHPQATCEKAACKRHTHFRSQYCTVLETFITALHSNGLLAPPSIHEFWNSGPAQVGIGSEKANWKTVPKEVVEIRVSELERDGVRSIALARASERSSAIMAADHKASEIFSESADRSCIDCDTCRWMAPEVFSRAGGQSAVHKQPATPEGRLRALQALVSWPTGSIRTLTPSEDVPQAQKTFPLCIDEYLPYFIQRPEGNILVDSPRFNERLAKRLETMGGVKYMFLTHKDDVCDHKKWKKRFNLTRIIHKMEVQRDTEDVEVKLEGLGPWNLGSDIEVIFTPGHSPAHVVLLLKDRQALFTGDHIGASMTNEIFIDQVHNCYSIEEQAKSYELLLPKDFLWVLPGHWRRYKFQDLEDNNTSLRKAVAVARGVTNGQSN